jgi:hypothetical protein
MTSLVRVAARLRAHDILADQRSFILDEETWSAFVEKLDRPARPDPRLVEDSPIHPRQLMLSRSPARSGECPTRFVRPVCGHPRMSGVVDLPTSNV